MKIITSLERFQWLDELRHRPGELNNRSTAGDTVMQDALMAMQTHKEALGIPEQHIKIFSYLTANSAAIIDLHGKVR